MDQGKQHGGARGNNSKTLRKRLQRQLEFYLSESNIRQDKFLQQNMDENGFVPIKLFLAFNKVKSMNATEKMVRDAIEKSAHIRMSSDHAAIAPVELPFEKEDHSLECTVYIENFSVGDDHDSLRKLLSKFGKVNLVSMPRFSHSKKFKGFAFVEFASVSAAENVVEAAHAVDPDLKGIRAMPKARWQDMKQQLKDQLASATVQPAMGDPLSGTRSKKEMDAHPAPLSETVSSGNVHSHAITGKRKAGDTHIFFSDGEDDAEEVEIEISAASTAKKPKL